MNTIEKQAAKDFKKAVIAAKYERAGTPEKISPC